MGSQRKVRMLEEQLAKSERTVAELLQRVHEQSEQIAVLMAKVETLTLELEKRDKVIHEQSLEIKELKRRLGQDSTNSHFPSSRDIVRKPQNNRTPGGKKGAPHNHKGTNLSFSPTPDEVMIQPLHECPDCQASLVNEPVIGYQARQVFDMPQPTIWKTEYRAEQKRCLCCRKKQQAPFPEDVRAYVQYGPRLSAFVAYLHSYQLLPLARMSELIHVLTGCKPSEKTLLDQIHTTAQTLMPYIDQIRDAVRKSPVIHADETSLQVEKKEKWVHVNSTPTYTLLGVDVSRGSEGMKSLQVLDTYTGIVVHDSYVSYFKKDVFSFGHALCNAHLMRECKGIATYDDQTWASEMLTLLRESSHAVKMAEGPLPDDVVYEYEQRYDHILEKSRAEVATIPIPEKTGPRGRKSNSKAGNLAARFETRKEAILRFLHDPRVPFDNNMAERDLRMVVVKEKISGCFRTPDSPDDFASIRSFVSTLIKQQHPILASLMLASSGSFSFPPTPSQLGS